MPDEPTTPQPAIPFKIPHLTPVLDAPSPLVPSRRFALTLVMLIVGVGLPAGGIRAQEAPPTPEILQRYEQLLERAPMAGPTLDRVLALYVQGEGLDQLDQRWAALAAQPGAKGTTYSLLRGLLADHLGRGDDALRFLQAATASQPDDYHGWLVLGEAEGHQGQWADAIAAYQKGLATKVAGDDRLTLFHQLGHAQQSNLDLAGALATWRQVVAEFPDDPVAVEEAGTAELDAEQFDDARKTFQQLVNIAAPDSLARVQALIHVAEVDDKQGNTAAAVQGYAAILPLTAEDSWLNRQLRAQIEQSFRRNDDLAGLVAYYQRWTQANPKDVDALLLQAGVLGDLNRKPEALVVLRQATVLAPDRHQLRQTLVEELVAAGQFAEAIAVGTALIADDPTEPHYWETLGEAFWQQTQPPTAASRQAALAAWAHLAPADTKDVAAILALARLDQQHQLNDEALANYRRALALTPGAADIREQAARLLFGLKREVEAWAVLDDLVASDRATAANYARLAGLDQQFQRAEAAAAAIQKGLALEPKNYELLSLEWSRLATAQDWAGVVALFDRLMASAPDASYAEQVEIRQLQSLGAAGQLDATAQHLQARLGTEPGLMEAELRLLLRILVQQGSPATATALAEARRRFPASASLGQIEAEFDRQQGNFDAAAAALQRLVDADPLQKIRWLTALARMRQDQGDLPAALAVAGQIIAASPASPAGYLLTAKLAFALGQDDDAVARLKAAIRLGEHPNAIRLQLAQHYLDTGQAALARAIYDEAFAAADDPAEKLALVRTMTAAWLQDGRTGELLDRFKAEEKAEEEGGGHYAAFVATIYEAMHDPGAARRELATALAAHPRDIVLLHAVIELAKQEFDVGAELLHYREQLAAAENTEANQFALATEYAAQNRPADVWRLVQANTPDVMKNPLVWKDLPNQVSDQVVADKIRALVATALNAQAPDQTADRFALGELQLMQGDVAEAQKTFWALLASPPALATVTPATTGPVTPVGSAAPGTPPANTFAQRVAAGREAAQRAKELLDAAEPPASAPRSNDGSHKVSASAGNTAPAGLPTGPVAVRDGALVTLSLLAVRQNTYGAFLQELQTRMAAGHWSLADRLSAALFLYVASERQPPSAGGLADRLGATLLYHELGLELQTIEELAASAASDRELDHFGYDYLTGLLGQTSEPALRARMLAARTALAARLDAEPEFHKEMLLKRVLPPAEDEAGIGTGDHRFPLMWVEKPDLAAFADWLKLMNRHQPEDLIQVITVGAQLGDWATVRAAVADLLVLPNLAGNLMFRQQHYNVTLAVLSPFRAGQAAPPDDLPALALQLLHLAHPATRPVPPVDAGNNQSFYHLQGAAGYLGPPAAADIMLSVDPDAFLPPNRYWPGNQNGMLRELWQGMHDRKLLPAFYATLDAEQGQTGDWRQTYPALLRIYFHWWDGRHDEAVAATRALLAAEPGDDFRALLAIMLNHQKKYAEELTVLQDTPVHGGPDDVALHLSLLLHTAVLAQNQPVGQAAGERLFALTALPDKLRYVQDSLPDLRTVGLGAKADQWVADILAAVNANHDHNRLPVARTAGDDGH